MKNIFTIRPFLLIVLLFFASCVPDDEFEVPDPDEQEVDLPEANAELGSVLGAIFQSPEEIITFEEDIIVEAYVVSSDEAGNFYKEIIVQDKPENPTAGVAIQVNRNSYFETFNFGRKILINLKGLSLGQNNGIAMLGIAHGKLVEPIPQSLVSSHLIRTPETAEIVPLPVKAIEFNDHLENLYVKVTNVQFSSFLVNSENPYSFAGENNDEFDGERLVVSCTGDFSFILSTSTFAEFKTFTLPEGSGSMTGILTRDFYDEKFTIYVNSPEDINFEGERCDPETFDCGLAQSTGEKVLFEADFEEQDNNDPVEGNGWTNFVQEGSEAWEGFEASGENLSLGRSARVQTPGSGDYKTVSWLITPEIVFEEHEGEVLQFKSSTSFANNSKMEVLISFDWDGTTENFQEATWQILSSAYVAQRSDFFGDWISSGMVDLSCATESGYIGFKYTGSDQPYYDGIYELDEVRITAE